MTTIHGFELLREQDIPEINSHARIFRHVRTGAELISLENDDTNKVFGVTFATPPSNSTGVAHILEHAVLSGSRKYPLKDPFVQLIKGSLAGFINAMTGSDKTMYPVATQNLKDFYNLIDVYLDAVFYPNITKETLQQEGWHYELEIAGCPADLFGHRLQRDERRVFLARWCPGPLYPAVALPRYHLRRRIRRRSQAHPRPDL